MPWHGTWQSRERPLPSVVAVSRFVVRRRVNMRWGQLLSQIDRLRYWNHGKARAYDTAAAAVAVQQEFGLHPDAQKQRERVDREFHAFVSSEPMAAVGPPDDRGDY